MYRSEKLVIRLTVTEREQIMRLAEAERIPPSTLARSILLKQADTEWIREGDRKAQQVTERHSR